jgi:hypothetical protein
VTLDAAAHLALPVWVVKWAADKATAPMRRHTRRKLMGEVLKARPMSALSADGAFRSAFTPSPRIVGISLDQTGLASSF